LEFGVFFPSISSPSVVKVCHCTPVLCVRPLQSPPLHTVLALFFFFFAPCSFFVRFSGVDCYPPLPFAASPFRPPPREFFSHRVDHGIICLPSYNSTPPPESFVPVFASFVVSPTMSECRRLPSAGLSESLAEDPSVRNPCID